MKIWPAPISKERVFEISAYLISVILTIVILDRLLLLRRADWSIPFAYAGDSLLYSYITKAIITKGWYLTNSSLGMPGIMFFHEYPLPDNIHFFIIKVIGWFSSNYAVVINIFYLLTYPLTTICALYVLRHFGVSLAPALLASLLYNFTFNHLYRGEDHLMYATYYMVPLVVMIILWLLLGTLKLKRFAKDDPKRKPNQRKLIIAVLICILTASTGGGYYSFFACTLLFITALVMIVRQKKVQAGFLPALFAAIIFSVLIINITPNLIYRYQNGKTGIGKRVPWESEMYGFKIAQLLMPVQGHRLKPLANLRSKYDSGPTLNTENGSASIGIIGSIGFIILIGWLLLSPKPIVNIRLSEERSNKFPTLLLDNLSILNGWAVLVATIGGLGTMFAYLISPQIRSYNRFSAYISFFAFMTIALLLDFLIKKYSISGKRRFFSYAALLVLLMLSIMDQIPRGYRPNYDQLKANFKNDQKFIAQIEANVPENSMIFQLPVYFFPEDISLDHMKAYLHSNKLRWSFGSMYNRYAHKWQKEVEAKPIDKMLEGLVFAGFSGIYIDRYWFKEYTSLEEKISELLNNEPIVSSDNRLSFFNIIPYREALKKNLPSDIYLVKSKLMLNPFVLTYKGFSDVEGTSQENWRWGGAKGEIIIENPLNIQRIAFLEMRISAPKGGKVIIDSQFLTDEMSLVESAVTYRKNIIIPPGKHTVRFKSTAKVMFYPPDVRAFGFKVDNFKVVDAL